PEDEQSPKIWINGKGSLSGPLKIDHLSGSADFEILSPLFANQGSITATAKLSDGEGVLSIKNQLNSLQLNALFNFSSSNFNSIDLELNSFRPGEYDESFDCVDVTSKISYSYSPSKLLEGNGSIALSRFSFGCAPYKLSLQNPQQWKITQGATKIPALEFIGDDSNVILGGSITANGPVNLNADGSLHLDSIAYLLPNFDDIRGFAKASLNISGTTDAPQFEGKVILSEAEFYIEDINLSAEKIAGELVLRKDNIEVSEITGIVNGGNVSTYGTVFPFALERSNIRAQFEGIELDNIENTSIIASGSLMLGPADNGDPTLSGIITIDNAEFEKKLDISAILGELSSAILKP
ncbi:MAG: translocation/assembly module TamB domain-containing protein, partial [Bdellovibrionales bacterium]|nr:translocation/assembly module TamB domain-containing protein [Bdellovibrionales bacterium]